MTGNAVRKQAKTATGAASAVCESCRRGMLRSSAAAHAWRALLIPLLAAFAIAPVLAQADDAPLADEYIEQIVVVANKDERSVRDVAATVTVLSQESLALELAASMADVLRYTPGIDHEGAGSRFGSEGINIRGIGGNRVALLVDGVPLGQQFDVGSFSNATRDFIDAGFIHRAEVLHGPASALYGSAAIGGVVSLHSPEVSDLTGADANGGTVSTAWHGSDSSLHATAMQAGRSGRFGALAGISARDGHEQESAAVADNPDLRNYQRRSGMLKFSADDVFGNAWSLGYYGHSSEVASASHSMLGSSRFRSTTALEGDDRYRMDLVSAAFAFGNEEGLIDTGVVRAYYRDTDIEQRTLDERAAAARPVSINRFFSFAQELRGLELNLQKRWSGEHAQHSLGFGLEYRERRTQEYRDALETGLDDGERTNVLLGEVFPLRDFPLSESTDFGVYLEDAVSAGAFTVIAALRVDRYELDAVSDPLYAENYPFATPVSLAVSDLSPKLGIVYHPADNLDLYVQYAHGFRAPPFEDANIGLELPAFNIRAIPNPDLASESSDGIDIGLRWRGRSGGAHLALFRTRYDDFIESKMRIGTDPVSGRILFQSQNISEALIEGIEAGGSLALTGVAGELSLSGSLYIARGENRQSGQPLNSVGPAQMVVGIDWSPDGGNWQMRFMTTLTKRWSDRDESLAALFVPPGYALFDLFLSRRIGEVLRVHGGISNLTDRKYWMWSEVGGLDADDPVIPFLARPGRSVALGVEIQW